MFSYNRLYILHMHFLPEITGSVKFTTYFSL